MLVALPQLHSRLPTIGELNASLLTKRLWEMGDVVDVLEAWEVQHAIRLNTQDPLFSSSLGHRWPRGLSLWAIAEKKGVMLC